MVGELLQNIFTEVAGTDPYNQRVATLPMRAAKLNIGLHLFDGPTPP